MSDFNGLSAETLEQLRKKLAQALETAESLGVPELVNALRESNELVSTLVAPAADRSSRYAGSIDYTFEDEACEPYGREVDVRIYYDWQDYDPRDEPRPIWGAQIAEVEIRAVRYFDRNGNVQGVGSYHDEVAWDLVEKERDYLTERCTDDGCRNEVGKSYPLHSPGSARCTVPITEPDARRMAPSARIRASTDSPRRFG